MPFIVDWVDQCAGKQDTYIIKMPAGVLQVQSCDDVIIGTDWLACDDTQTETSTDFLATQINRYWLQADDCINLKLLKTGSTFQFKVWQELALLKFGETVSYKYLAQKLNTAPRAIGGACRANPYPLIIPCHRVVAMTSSGGYAGQTQGWLMEVKLTLLDFERKGI